MNRDVDGRAETTPPARLVRGRDLWPRGYVHTPFAAVSTVATERADATPYGFEKMTTCSPAVWVGTLPVSWTRPPNTT